MVLRDEKSQIILSLRSPLEFELEACIEGTSLLQI
jgi:hypothetical protein